MRQLCACGSGGHTWLVSDWCCCWLSIVLQVTSGVEELGLVDAEAPACFAAQATAAAALRPHSARRPQSATTRSSRRPQSGTTRQTISRPSTAATRGARTARPNTATSRRTVGSATARSHLQESGAVRRRQRPISAVSLGGVSIIQDDYTDWQDDDDVTVDDGATAMSASTWRHPASVLSSRAVRLLRVV